MQKHPLAFIFLPGLYSGCSLCSHGDLQIKIFIQSLYLFSPHARNTNASFQCLTSELVDAYPRHEAIWPPEAQAKRPQ